jgi:hypothetical protein
MAEATEYQYFNNTIPQIQITGTKYVMKTVD